MKRSYLFVILLFVVLLGGCTQPNALTHFKKDKLFSKALLYTSKSDIIKNKEIIAMLNATYLNSTDSSFNSKTQELFIVGIYLPKYDEKKSDDYLKGSYSLVLNQVKPDSIEELSKEHKMFGNLPLYNPWAKYYVVKFNKKKLIEKYQENFTKYQKYTDLRYENITLSLNQNIPSVSKKQTSNTTTVTFQAEL